jgi:hypothetical protein
MKRTARLAPPEPPTQEDLEAGGLASSQMSFIYRVLAGGAPHGLTMIQVARRLGWRRPTVQALLERAHRLRVADRCSECSRWLPGVNPTAAASLYGRLAVGRPEGPSAQPGDLITGTDGALYRVVGLDGAGVPLVEPWD